MIKKLIAITVILLFSIISKAQTTDLSIVVIAQNLDGIDVSQVEIYQEFQYIVKIINSGNSVSNASFSQSIDSDVTVLSFISQNNLGGASDVTNLNFSNNQLTGTIANLPNNSSIEIKVLVNAPTTLGGIATTATVSSPSGTQDTNPSNNQSIISIDVIDVVIDFTVVQSQVSPAEGTGISSWDDTVTYEFTITNNSTISYPLAAFSGTFELNSSLNFGRPRIQLMSIECLGGNNGMSCPDLSSVAASPVVVSSIQSPFSFGNSIEFTSGGSLTFRVVYGFLEPLCAVEQQPIDVSHHIEIILEHTNVSSNISNEIEINLLTAELCELTDLCVETIQINPTPTTVVQWEEEVTFTTTACNNGPLPALMRFFVQNLSVNVDWEIISLTCVGTTGAINCDDFTLSQQDNLWTSNEFIMPADVTITVEMVVIFFEPECSTSPNNTIAHVRSGVNLLSTQIMDPNLLNNAESDYVTLPPSNICSSSDLSISKTQIDPVLPIGSSPSNTTNWGNVTYEITVSNPSGNDTFIVLSDFMPQGFNQFVTASLVSVECVGVTGTATCQTIEHANIGIELDGEPEDGILDVFWEIVSEDNWSLPAQSSVTFQVVVFWSPECSTQNIRATNKVSVSHAGSVVDNNNNNNSAQVDTYFAPCVDLIVQTFPQFTQVSVNQSFDWIIDVTNSNTSSNAVDIYFEDTLGTEFTIVGTPACQVTSGSAACITNFNISSNIVIGTIPNMEAGSTVRIRIPVTAPAFGGAFSNEAEATPDTSSNEEQTPETNLSISNVQVIAPTLIKNFVPNQIMIGEESVLSFTVININSNPSQNNISFTDILPSGLTLTESPYWIEDNGCTAIFVGNVGDGYVGVTNLTFPNGVASCTFSVAVTSQNAGNYLNNNINFADQNNIDVSQTSATLSVFEDNSDVDIEILKDVSPIITSIGSEVQFTITATNLGTTTATLVELYENLPNGYQYVSSNTSMGVYDVSNYTWSIDELNPGESAQLHLNALVVSSNNLLNIAMLQSLFEIDRNENNNEDSAIVNLSDCLIVPQGFSPNSDGLNDYFVIPCIENYNDSLLKIFNRLGVQVFEQNTYKNDWDGTPNMGFPKISSKLPVGTYFYILEIEGLKAISGWLYLNY